VPPVPASLPAIYGSDAFLKVLSDEGELSVYLLAIDGAKAPWVVKMLPPPLGSDPEALSAETRSLCRMRSGNLAKVLDCAQVEGEFGVVMEHVPGKSLEAILDEARSRSILLPPELGAVLAHDGFAAIEYFRDFENGSRVHGNITPWTLIVGYTGEVKVVGFRPGSHPRADGDVQAARDVMAIAEILKDLPFKSFPKELVQTLPRLLDEKFSPLEAMATAKAFARGQAPSADDRRKVAAWLEEVFPGHRDKEAQEGERLLADGLKLIALHSSKERGWAQNPSLGDQIGEYKLVQVLGEGGMGRVYEAEHVPDGKRVALKVLHPRGRSRAIEERFRREAESILRVADPHVVNIEHFGASDDGRFLYLAMELLSGESLDRVIAKAAPLDPRRALRIASQVCQALVAAHEAGVIHRDLKPGNVMLVRGAGKEDSVKVLDFGLARLDVGESALTRTGDLIGTFVYMAPEQGQGKPATPKIDIYAVGELLYEMLTKKLPHEGSTDVLARKATVDPTPITQHRPDLPAEIDRLVMRALARDPEARQPTMAEARREIDEAIQHLDAAATPAGRSWATTSLAVVVLVVVGAGAWFFLRPAPSNPPSVIVPNLDTPPPAVALPAAKPSPTGPAPEASPEEPSPPPEPAPTVRPRPTEPRHAKRRPEESPTEQTLRAADVAFDDGNRIEAVKLATQALAEGGRARAHLALGRYLRSMHRYQEALGHYRAALELEPGNTLAATGVEVLEKQLAPGP
jgi:eukaryotic-like serine/threonine-protein kinase